MPSANRKQNTRNPSPSLDSLDGHLLRLCVAVIGMMLCGRAACQPIDMREVGAGAHVLLGQPGPASPANRGEIGNIGVIAGDSGVVVIGTGTSAAHGERVIQAIATATQKPIVLALNTFAAAEHVLGNGAFARRGIPILAHRETDRFMALNCETCIRNLGTEAGEDAVAGTLAQRPTRLIDSGTELDAGGRRIDVLHFGSTQQAGTLAVFDPASGVLFAGALVTPGVIPDAANADVDTWLAALTRLRRLPVRTLVPGQGPPTTASGIDDVTGYLQALHAAVRAAYARGMSLAETTSAVTLPAYSGWAMHERRHARNVHFLYLKLEAQDLTR